VDDGRKRTLSIKEKGWCKEDTLEKYEQYKCV